MSERGGKKGTNTTSRLIHRGAELISDGDTVPMKMIGRPSSARWADKVDNVACAYTPIPMARRGRSTGTGTHSRRPLVTPMNGKVTIASSEPPAQCVTARQSGREMRMAMECQRCMATPSKDCGRPPVTCCARFAVGTRRVCNTIWRCANIKAISTVSAPKFISQLVAEHKSIT